MDQTITMEAIRARYPNAVRCPFDNADPDGQYDVGGALHLFLRDLGFRNLPFAEFPSVYSLSSALQVCNPHLSHDDRVYFATWIIALADNGRDLAAAWETLHQALTYREEEEKEEEAVSKLT